jgi:hypothetical protein
MFLPVLPKEVERNAFEGVDKREEEVLDEELVMGGIKIVE